RFDRWKRLDIGIYGLVRRLHLCVVCCNYWRSLGGSVLVLFPVVEGQANQVGDRHRGADTHYGHRLPVLNGPRNVLSGGGGKLILCKLMTGIALHDCPSGENTLRGVTIKCSSGRFRASNRQRLWPPRPSNCKYLPLRDLFIKTVQCRLTGGAHAE